MSININKKNFQKWFKHPLQQFLEDIHSLHEQYRGTRLSVPIKKPAAGEIAECQTWNVVRRLSRAQKLMENL